MLREHEGVVVADLLVPTEAGGDAEDGGHVAAHLPFLKFGVVDEAVVVGHGVKGSVIS